jgi:signal transduction histidine kinase
VAHAGAYRTVAAYPLSVHGEARHLLSFGLKDARQWSEREMALIRAVGRGLSLVLDRTTQARQLEEERAALEAFTAFAEAAGTTTDVPTLTRRAIEVLRARFSAESTCVYYERDGDFWKARVWSDNLEDQPELLATLRAGLPLDTPVHAEAARTRQPVFTERWDAGREQIQHSEAYGAAANYPLVVGGEVRGFMALGLRHTREWSERDKALLRAVGRSLSLALERAGVTGQLLAQRQSLEAANEELEAFAYSVSHDLRTPVRHVMSFNGLLRTQLGTGLDAKAARYLTIVDEAAGRMNTLIDAMLNLSRTSRLPLRLGPVDLGELVGSVRTELEPDVLERAVEWRVAPLPLVHGDHDTLRQVMTNLLDNALKYTRTREVARIEVWAEERPQAWVVCVRDNGVGFDPRYGNKLFGVFQRLHRAEEFEGTGVGLANVRRIITRHGGRVSAEGQPGEGATFRFTLPRH